MPINYAYLEKSPSQSDSNIAVLKLAAETIKFLSFPALLLFSIRPALDLTRDFRATMWEFTCTEVTRRSSQIQRRTRRSVWVSGVCFKFAALAVLLRLLRNIEAYPVSDALAAHRPYVAEN